MLRPPTSITAPTGAIPLLACLAALLAVMILLPCSRASAQNDGAYDPGGERVPEEVLSHGEEEDDSFEAEHEKWSKVVLSTASYMDQFFDNEHYRTTSNKTYLRLRLTPLYNKDGFSFDPYLDIRLQMPKTERWLLHFGGDPSDEARYGSTPQQDAEVKKGGNDKENGFVGVETFFKNTRTRNVGMGGGIRFREQTIVPYVAAKWVELWELDHVDVRFIERVRYYTDTGPELRTQLDLDWPLAHKFFARVSGSMTLEKDQEDKNFDIQYSLYQYLTTRRALLYQATTGYATSPDRATHLDTANYEIQYRQQWRDWFYTTLIGQLTQEDSNDWDIEPGIRIDFNIILGYTSQHSFSDAYDAKQQRLREREWEKLDERMKKLNKEKEE